jgi:hypothetical protein
LSAILDFQWLGGGWGWAIALLLVGFFGSIALATILLVYLPADYFIHGHRELAFMRGRPILRFAAKVLKNVIGAILVVAGIVMLFTPGQGVLTVLIGVMLLDFPGKQQLERKLLGQPKVLHAVNGLRARFGKPPVQLDSV